MAAAEGFSCGDAGSVVVGAGPASSVAQSLQPPAAWLTTSCAWNVGAGASGPERDAASFLSITCMRVAPTVMATCVVSSISACVIPKRLPTERQ